MTPNFITKSLSKLIDRLALMWLNRDMLMEKKPPKTFQEHQEEADREYVRKEIVPRKKRGLSLREIGNETGLSYEHVRQLLKKYGGDEH